MQWNVAFSGKSHIVQIPDSIPDNTPFDAVVDGRNVQLRWQRQTRTLFILDPSKNQGWSPINIRSRTVTKFPGDGDIVVNTEFSTAGCPDPVILEATVASYFPGQDSKESNAKKKAAIVRSQITGKVLKVLVKSGDTVAVGDTLLIIEAMKMENRVLSSTNGIIDTVKVKEADTVSTGAELVKFK